jgi:hypothetical protein
MRLKKVLLYPFSAETSYFESYAWALELASRMNARLQLFTTTTPGRPSTTRDSIYHSLLQAQGYYLQRYHHASNPAEARSEACIAEGSLPDELVTHLKKNPVDVVILDPTFISRHHRQLGDIINASGGVIALTASKDLAAGETSINTDHFYDVLRHAELYKLPENFFTTLGKDHSLFNYLRKLFQRKQP